MLPPRFLYFLLDKSGIIWYTYNNMKRLIAIGDIHGCFGMLKELVEKKIRFNPETDTLVFMGDYIDRGKESFQVIAYIKALKDKFPDSIIILRGNHENLAQLAFSQGDAMHQLWMVNGGRKTIDSFHGKKGIQIHLLPFIREYTQVSYETGNFIFVHGGIPMGNTLENSTPYELMWDRCGWWFGDKKLIVGHTPKDSVTIIGKMIFVDTGAVFGGALTGYEVNTGTVFSVGKKEKAPREIDISWVKEASEDTRKWLLSQQIDNLMEEEELPGGVKRQIPLFTNSFRSEPINLWAI